MGGFLLASYPEGNPIPRDRENNLPKYRNCVAVQKYAEIYIENLRPGPIRQELRQFPGGGISAAASASYFIY